MDSGPHIPSRRLIDFMISRLSLTEQEHNHLAKCSVCQKEMTDATSREMNVPEAAGERGDHVLRSRLVAFMLHQFRLTERESDHLAKCEKCQEDMTDATREEWHTSEKKDRPT